MLMETRYERARRLAQGQTAPMFALWMTQLMGGAWVLTQISFFPIYLEENLRLAPVAISAVIALGQAAGMLAALLGGGLTDQLGSKWVFALGWAAAIAASLVFQTTLPALVALLWALSGVAVSLQTLGGSSYLTRMADPRRLGLFTALGALCYTAGGALGSPLAGRLLDSAGFRSYGLLGLGLLAFTLFVTLFLLPTERSEGYLAGASPTRTNVLALLHRPEVRLLVGLRFLPTLYYGISLLVIPLLINHLAGSKTTVAIYSTASLIAASAAQLLTGRAADRYGHRWPTLISYGMLVVAALGLAVFSGRLWGIFVFGILGNAVAWALASLMFCLVADGVPRSEHGRAFGLLHATWSIAMMAGSVLGGALLRVMPGLPFLVAGLLNGLSVALTLAFFAHMERAINRPN